MSRMRSFVSCETLFDGIDETMTLNPNTVLITGANRGIGLEMVKQFLTLPRPPCHVFATYKSVGKVQELEELSSQNPSLSLIHMDVSDEETIQKAKAAVEEIIGNKGLTLLINNAGIANGVRDDNLQSVTSQNMVDLFQTNTIGTLMVVKAFLPLLQKSAKENDDMSLNRAAVINISSGAGSISRNDMGGGYAYRSSKAAQNMITRSLSIDLRSSGIFVAALHPGWVQTDMGGPKAKETASESVRKLLKVMEKLHGEDMSGNFYDNSGQVIPW